MIHLTDRKDCCGCSACASACPHGAITMVPDGMGFRYPSIDYEACVDCHLCEEICAFHRMPEREDPPAEAIRFPSLMDESQSGGLAFALMRKAVREGMVVYGAAMDPDFVVRHRRVEKEEELPPLRLSKYVQSDMEGIPAAVVADLRAGRKVFFTGMPCQCAGIASIGRRWRERLLLCDIICHGVPSPYVWRDYLAFREQEAGEKLTGALFRDPSLGWHGAKEALFFGERKVVSNEYAGWYFRRLMFRPSCTDCPFASLSRPGDVTAGDCWGVEQALPGFADDNRGCSLLLKNTPAGEEFVREFPGEAVRRQSLDVRSVLQQNLEKSSVPDFCAKSFENVYLRRGYSVVRRQFRKNSMRMRLMRWARKAGIKL